MLNKKNPKINSQKYESSSDLSLSRSHSRSRSRSRSEKRKAQKDKKDKKVKKYEKESNNKRDFENKPEISQPEEEKKEEGEKKETEKPNFNPSGILAKFTNSVNGAVLKFTEPLEAKVPEDIWKIFPFKGKDSLEVIPLVNHSCFLFGKDRRISDIPLDHPSISNQHAVIQFRELAKQDEYGNSFYVIKPYLMDLESTNGTFLNGERIDAARYYEIKHGDVLKFAGSTRDYVIMKQK